MVVPNNIDELHGSVIESQIQSIQEKLSDDIIGIVVKENELASSLMKLKNTPYLVIADSQTIGQVAEEIPESVKLTTYSILMARQNGNISEFIKAIKRVRELENGDKVLISEGCDHHLQEYEIGKIKIQEWLKLYSKKKLQIDFSNGCGFPDNLSDYNLIVHCDGCRLTIKSLHSRIKQAKLLDIPIINYGVLISYLSGAIPRSLFPFKEVIAEWGKVGDVN